MRRPLLVVPCAVIAGLAMVAEPVSVHALGFNTAMLYRYPWQEGISMTRTQGQGDADPSHRDHLYYAVDWDNGSGNWLVHSANGGRLRCVRESEGVANGLGNFIGIYNAAADQTAMYGHLDNCAFFAQGVVYDATQGQGLAPAGTTGVSSATHLHFHVVNGNDLADPTPNTVPFAMSDRDTFERGQGTTDGPSDNAGVAYTDGTNADTGIRNAYLAEGGASGSWWNVGATYHATTDSGDEWGGPCRNTSTRFVHLCASNFGAGLAASQNYIDWKGVRHSVYRTDVGGHVKGQIQGALSNRYQGEPLSEVMGAPTGGEAGGQQNFQGGYIVRNNGAGVRVDVYRCFGGCVLVAVMRYSSYGIFCPSVDANRVVNSADLGLVASAFGTPGDMLYDLDANGSVGAADLGLVALRFSGTPCPVADP